MTLNFRFNEEDLTLLAKTADALTAMHGRPIFCEVMSFEDEESEYAFFALPLMEKEEDYEEKEILLLGGPKAKIVGQSGGLDDLSQMPYECVLLYAITMSDHPEKYVLLDHEGEWMNSHPNLEELLPLSFNEPDTDDQLDEDILDVSEAVEEVDYKSIDDSLDDDSDIQDNDDDLSPRTLH